MKVDYYPLKDVNNLPCYGITVMDNTMLEKSSRIVLTKEDLEQYYSGQVSERLRSLWSLDLNALREIVESKTFTLIDHE